jgi:hypothetical protein
MTMCKHSINNNEIETISESKHNKCWTRLWLCKWLRLWLEAAIDICISFHLPPRNELSKSSSSDASCACRLALSFLTFWRRLSSSCTNPFESSSKNASWAQHHSNTWYHHSILIRNDTLHRWEHVKSPWGVW